MSAIHILSRTPVQAIRRRLELECFVHAASGVCVCATRLAVRVRAYSAVRARLRLQNAVWLFDTQDLSMVCCDLYSLLPSVLFCVGTCACGRATMIEDALTPLITPPTHPPPRT